jgi:hypothetical protein
MSVEVWGNFTDYSNYRVILGKTLSNAIPAPYDFYAYSSTGLPRLERGNGAFYSSSQGSAAPMTGKWQHIAFAMAGTTVTHYLNGSGNGGGPLINTIADSGTSLNIGARANGNMPMKGSLDEVRISNVSRPLQWVQTEYNNQGSTFLKVNTQESAPMLTNATGDYALNITAPMTQGTYQVLVNMSYNGEYGQAMQTLVVMQYPRINSNGTNQSAYYNATVTIVANVTDDNLASVNFTLIASNGTVMLNNAAGTHTTGDLWTSQAFTLSSAGRWNYTIVAMDNDGNNDTASGQIRFLDISGTLTPARVSVKSAVIVSGQINDSSGAAAANASVGVCLNGVQQPSSWWNFTWRYRAAITINGTQVSGTLTDFPILVRITDADLVKAQASGNDIAFSNASGAKLDHEIEYYNSTSGELVAWVRMPVLSNLSDTTIYLYYGNPAAADQQNRTGVWNANLKGVWHLANGTILSGKDATAYGNDGSINAVTAATGYIDGAGNFTGSYVSVPENDALDPSSITLSAWARITASPTNFGNIVSKGDNSGYRFRIDNARTVTFMDRGGANSLGTTKTVTVGNWTFIVVSGNSSGLRIYLDGALNASNAVAYGSPNTTSAFKIGVGLSEYFNGLIDEVRIWNSSQSPAWISTEYNNQKAGSTFLSLGTEEISTNQSGQYTLTITAPATAGNYSVVVNATYNGEYGQATQMLEVTSDSCTPTPGQPWVLDLGDNCTISLVSIDVPSWTITGTKDGTVTIQDANIAYKNKTVGSIAGRGQIVYLGNVTIRAG